MRLLHLTVTLALATGALFAQADRIAGPVSVQRVRMLRGHIHPLARPQFDRGRLAAGRKLGTVTMHFTKTADQQAALDALLADQQAVGSVAYHRWLTPEQFGQRFGVSAKDAAQVTAWLKAQGLKVEGVSRARTWVSLTGTAGDIERAFSTELHSYLVDGEEHFAPAVEPSLPDVLAPVVAGIEGLDDFDPKAPRTSPMLNLTDGSHALGPDDFATIYNVKPLLAAGFDGSGISIAIAGRTDIGITDFQAFRNYFGMAANDPEIVLCGTDPGVSSGDVGEALLDVSWAGAVAPKAKVLYYNSTNVYTSVQCAVDQARAQVISFSYGSCEQNNTGSSMLVRRALAQQANAQGMTWVASAGDSGAATCEVHQTNTLATKGLAASLPATIPEVTAVGGTQLDESAGGYWATRNSSTYSSALSYIPEVPWAESADYGAIVAGGSGPSVYYSKPAWQTGPGVPALTARLTPDISFMASAHHDGYIIFKGGGMYRSGGTSASAPAFAGILAILNQYVVAKGLQSSPGLGNVNPALYKMAQSTPAAFHDIATGNNKVPCLAGSPNCVNGMLGYDAGVGYDLATGLGSLDVNAFVTGWDQTAATTTTTLTTSTGDATLNDTLQLSASVAAASGSAVPTGTLIFSQGSTLLGSVVLDGAGKGSLKVYASQFAVGADTVLASYMGDAKFNGSTGSAKVNVTVPSGNSAVVPSITNPVFQHAPDANGFTFSTNVFLTEMAGVATTLTDFQIDGTSYPVSWFGDGKIPAKGTISTGVASRIASLPAVRVYTFIGKDASGFQWKQEVSVQYMGPGNFTQISSAANGASFTASYAPGMIMSIFGAGLASATRVASGSPLPTTLANTTVTVNGAPAPLWFVSSGQINLQLPYDLPVGNSVVEVNNAGQKYSFSFPVAKYAPGIFSDAKGFCVPTNTAARGQAIYIYITGAGAVTPALVAGTPPAVGTPVDQLPVAADVSVTVGKVPAKLYWAGIPSDAGGAMQVIFWVPDTAPLGAQGVVVTVGGVSSAAAGLNVTAAAPTP